MKTIFAIVACLLVNISVAQTQVPNDFSAGQPARASEVNENFDALEAAIDANAVDNSAQDAMLSRHDYQLFNLDQALQLLGQEYGVCSSRNISACQGLLGDINLALFDVWISFDVLLVADPASLKTVFAHVWHRSIGNPGDPTDDSIRLIFGRGANFTRLGNEEVLVDTCTDPTVYLVPTGSPRIGGLGVDNGKTYIGDDGAAPATLDVTGGSYGLIHDYTEGFPQEWDGMGPPPLCLPVSDREGLYDSYPLIFREDTSTWDEQWSLTADDLLNP